MAQESWGGYQFKESAEEQRGKGNESFYSQNIENVLMLGNHLKWV